MFHRYHFFQTGADSKYLWNNFCINKSNTNTLKINFFINLLNMTKCIINTRRGRFLLIKSSISNFSGNNLFLSCVMMSAALLKRHSYDAEDGGIDKYLLAKCARIGQRAFFASNTLKDYCSEIVLDLSDTFPLPFQLCKQCYYYLALLCCHYPLWPAFHCTCSTVKRFKCFA